MIKEFPTLYALAKTKKIKQWTTWVEEHENNIATIHVEAGYIDGKINDKPKTIKKGKNIGKSNETTPYTQAISDAQSKWNKKRDKNYELEVPDPKNYVPRIMLPQLAKGPGKGKIIYSCFIQPKLNGICNLAELLANLTVLHHSRGGKLFETIAHLDEWVRRCNPIAPLHGELYMHGVSLQTIGSYTKELKDDCEKLEFWVYDIAHTELPFEQRLNWMSENIATLPPECPIKMTPTFLVNNKEETKHYHDKFVSMGFEGGMLKNKNGIYMFQYNSDEIEKVKSFEDSEFEIVGGKQGEGLDEGCVVYRCKTESGLEFDVRPRGTVELRRKWFIELDQVIGKPLTVRYPELTDSGKPSQGVGIAIRDYE